MSQPSTPNTYDPFEALNWRLIVSLVVAIPILLVVAGARPDGYTRSVLLEVAAGLFVFLALQALLGREVEDHEHGLAVLIGVGGLVLVAIASLARTFLQSVLIELGMGALLFCLLDVLVVNRLKRRIEDLETKVPAWYEALDEDRREELEREFGKMIFGEDWEPGDQIGGFGGIHPEDHQRGLDAYEHELSQRDSTTPK